MSHAPVRLLVFEIEIQCSYSPFSLQLNLRNLRWFCNFLSHLLEQSTCLGWFLCSIVSSEYVLVWRCLRIMPPGLRNLLWHFLQSMLILPVIPPGAREWPLRSDLCEKRFL